MQISKNVKVRYGDVERIGNVLVIHPDYPEYAAMFYARVAWPEIVKDVPEEIKDLAGI